MNSTTCALSYIKTKNGHTFSTFSKMTSSLTGWLTVILILQQELREFSNIYTLIIILHCTYLRKRFENTAT